MKVPVLNQKGEKISETVLPQKIFGLPFNPDLVHQVLVAEMANRRKPIAHTKHRGEVSGGGRKPWPQKGTGRARHGSIRSPLWRHGGVVFGPRTEKVFSKKINRKLKRAALLQTLSQKAKQNLCIVLEDLSLEKPKTKELAGILKKVLPERKSTLLVLPEKDKTIQLAGRNIPFLKIKRAQDLNVLELLETKFLLIPKESIKVIKHNFA